MKPDEISTQQKRLRELKTQFTEEPSTGIVEPNGQPLTPEGNTDPDDYEFKAEEYETGDVYEISREEETE